MFRVTFFTTPSGKSPVEAYIDQQRQPVMTKIYQALKLLQAYGFTLPGKHIKKLAGTKDLWELRVKAGAQQHRLFFAQLDKELLILLHAVSKKRQKTHAHDLDTARERLQQYQKTI